MLVGPFFILAVGNLWLGSEFGKNYLESKLKQRVKLHFEIEKATWTPWHGLYLGDVSVYNKSDGVRLSHIDEIVVLTDFWSLCSGDIALRQVVVESPKVELSTEDLKVLLGDMLPGEGLSPTLPDKQAIGASADPQVHGASDVPQSASDPRVKSRESTGRVHNSDESESLLEKIQMNNAKVVIKDDKGRPLFTLEEANMKMPLLGTRGYLTFKKLSLAGADLALDARFTLSIENGRMRMVTDNFELFEQEVQMECLLDGRGVFQMNTHARSGEVLKNEDWGGWGLNRAQFKAQMAGLLYRPSTWLGRYAFDAEGFFLEHPAKKLMFDRVSSMGVLKRMSLEVPSFLCESAGMKINGKGQMGGKGDIKGVCRLLVAEDEEKDFLKFVGGLGFYVPLESLLGSKEWKYYDVEVGGKLWNPFVKEPRGWRGLREMFKTSRSFMKVEKVEKIEELKAEGK